MPLFPAAVFLAKSAVLSSFSTGRQTSLVVDAGHDRTVGEQGALWAVSAGFGGRWVGGRDQARCVIWAAEELSVLRREGRALWAKLGSRGEGLCCSVLPPPDP